MDEFTKRKVKRAVRENPDLPVKFIIAAIRSKQKADWSQYYIRGEDK